MIWAFIIIIVFANGNIIEHNKQAYYRSKPILSKQVCQQEAKRLKELMNNSIDPNSNIKNIDIICKKVPISSCFKHSQFLKDYYNNK